MVKIMLKRGINILMLLVLFENVFSQTDTAAIMDSTDSQWKSDPAFSYMTNLDSLLKAANVRQDSLNISFRHTQPGGSGLFSIFRNPVLQIIFWVVAAAFILYILYALFFRFRIFDKNRNGHIGAEVIDENILAANADYVSAIQKAVKEKKFNLAIRYHFISILAMLQEKGRIQFLPEKTNREYMYEINDPELKTDFSNVARIYEYVWYGDSKLNEDHYWRIQNQFDDLMKKISY